MNMEISKVCRITVDGIYYLKHPCEITKPFIIKNERKLGNEPSKTYISIKDTKEFITKNPYKPFAKNTLCLGAGGCGKTYDYLNKPGHIKTLYTAPSYKLKRVKENEFKCKALVWQKLLHCNEDFYNMIIRTYNVIIFDECSQMSEKQKRILMKRYSALKLVFIGDIGFQLPPFTGESINEYGFDKIIRYTTNYRIKDPKLKEILDKIRKIIENKEKNSDKLIIELLTKAGRYLPNELDNAKIGDYILCSTRAEMHQITEKFKDKYDKKKFYIKKTNKDYSNGDIIISDTPPNLDYEERYAFTVHSVQGETIKTKIFISKNKLFMKELLYTAISRAEYLDQIYLI
jgi:hypothetical protein